MIAKNSPIKLAVLIVAMVASLGQISVSAAKLKEATLVFTPGAGIKPKVHSEIRPVATRMHYATGANEMREVLLPDGTVLTLGLATELTVEKYAYSRDSRTGEIVIYVATGIVRVVGGVINNSSPITVRTPTAEIMLNNATANISVAPDDGLTRVGLLYGQSLTLSSGGQTETLVKPGFELVSRENRAAPEGPSRQNEQVALADMAALETGQLSKLEEGAEGLGYSANEGAEANRINALATEDQPVAQLDEPAPITDPPAAPGPVAGGSFSAGYGPGLGGDVSKVDINQPSQANNDHRYLAQTRDNAKLKNGVSELSRARGRTANRLYNARSEFTQTLLPGFTPTVVSDRSVVDSGTADELNYAFSNEKGQFFLSEKALTLNLDSRTDFSPGNHVLVGGEAGSFDVDAPFILNLGALPETGSIYSNVVTTNTKDEFEGTGSVFKDVTQYRILQSGFSNQPGQDADDNSINLIFRDPDNFLVAEVSPGKVLDRARDRLKTDYSVREDGAVVNTEGQTARDQFLSELDPSGVGFFDVNTSDPLSNSQIDQLAAVILDPNTAHASELSGAELDQLGFLRGSDKTTILGNVNVAESFAADPAATERYLFATGDVDAGRIVNGEWNPDFNKQASVDRFFLSAGLENFAQKDEAGRTLADGIRAFLRRETGLDLQLADTGLLVVNSASASSDAQDALLHADFGLAGAGSAQQSTISVTIGDVDYQLATCSSCGIQQSVETLVSGYTIGSSHGTIVNKDTGGHPGTPVENATVALTSPLRSTAAGGGNPALNRDGYAGYFVLENYDPQPQEATEAPLSGGTERPVGNPAGSQQYAYLRLATATASSSTGGVAVGTRSNLDLKGWVAGLAERETGSGLQTVQLDSGGNPDNVALQSAADTNRASAVIALTDHPVLALGGLSGDGAKGASAVVDDDRFAARTPGDGAVDAALVSGELVKAGLPPDMRSAIPDYQYLKWGFFFGDTLNDTAAQVREHVHLASWVAGRVPDAGDLPGSGSASYSGHAIGNVYTAGASYTAVGSYSNSWNFAQRRGTVGMQFDGTSYTGNTAIIDGTASFQGRIEAIDRVGGLQGNFVQGGSDPVAGVAGRFSIQETAGNIYRASGTFGAEKTATP